MQKKEKEKQLNLSLKNSPQNIYYKYKDQYELWLAGLETKKYIKDTLTWFSIIISLSFIITEIYMIETRTDLPSKIPLLTYLINPTKRLTIGEYIYLYPILGILILFTSVYFSSKYYHKERELSKTLLIVAILSISSLCIIFFKLLYTF